MLDDTNQKQSQKTQKDMTADPVIFAVIIGSQLESVFHRSEGMFHIKELFVSENDILNRQCIITGFNQEFAVITALFGNFEMVYFKPAVWQFFDIFPVDRMRLEFTDLFVV